MGKHALARHVAHVNRGGKARKAQRASKINHGLAHLGGNAPPPPAWVDRVAQLARAVGRLDKDSSGLILLTNDGDFAYQMTHPKFRKPKVYEVDLDRPLEPLHQQMITDYGVEIGDGEFF